VNEPALLGRLGSFRLHGSGASPAALSTALDPGRDASMHVEGPLAIASLTTEAEPQGTDRTLCLLCGSILDLPAIARSLGLESPASNEQILARGVEHFGEQLFQQLRGSFVLLFWDRERREGILVRDAFGARPLFLFGQGRDLIFSSEIRPLLEVLPNRPPPDEVGLGHWLTRRPGPPDRTLFEGVRRLPAGHLVRLSEAGFRVERWWIPTYRVPTMRPREVAAAMLRDEMTAAVRRSAGTANPVGIRLSGGFDSACVATLATANIGSTTPLRAYSGVFPDHPEADESARIADLRGHIGLEGVEQSFRGGSALTAAAEFIDAWDVPPSAPNWFVWRPLIRRAANDGMQVLLDGQSGDELFGCSPYLLADLLLRGRLFGSLAMAGRIPGSGPHPPPRWLWRALRQFGLRGAFPPRMHAQARRKRRQGRGGPPWLAQSTFDLVLASEQPYAWKKLPGPRWWAALLHSLVDGPDTLGGLDELRREATMDGVRFAHPWRDPKLIEHILEQPPELAFDPNRDRALARDAMREMLPNSILLNDQKPVFNILLEDSFAGPDASLVEDLLLHPPDELAPHLRRAEIPDLLDRRASFTGALEVWRLATTALWLRGGAELDSLSLLGRQEMRN
jgi:asparagine synthase (glutamine-hydrolysing)